MKSVEAHSPRVVVKGIDRPDLAAKLAAHEGTRPRSFDIDLDEIEDEIEVAVWCQFFREGSAQLDLCGNCGRPTGIFVPLSDWIEHPLVCRHCKFDLTE